MGSNMSLYRFLELIPGILTWATLGAVVVLSAVSPVLIAVFIIVFDVYWLFKTIYFSFHLRATFNKMRSNMKIGWLNEVKKLPLSPNSPKWQDIYHLVILPMYKEPYDVVKESFESLRKANYPKDKFIVVLACEERGGEESKKVAEKISAEFGRGFFKFLVTT